MSDPDLDPCRECRHARIAHDEDMHFCLEVGCYCAAWVEPSPPAPPPASVVRENELRWRYGIARRRLTPEEGGPPA